MKRFNTKKDLLRYLWKNEDDRKLVTRMVARGEVRLEWRVYIIDEEGTDEGRMQASEIPSSSSDLANRLSNDLEYLNKEYEKLEWLLDYSLRRCYDIMKKKGLVGSEDTYDDFYNKITAWYWVSITNMWSVSVAENSREEKAWLTDIMNKFKIGKASDFIS